MVKRDFIRNILLALLVIIILILLRIFVFSCYRVKQDTANSYLHKGDLIVLKRTIEPKYKDFVVYKFHKKTYISRVIATEGEAVTYMDDIFYLNGKVENQAYINAMKHKYLSTAPMGSLYTDDFTIDTLTRGKAQKIPKDYFLVLNDNRLNRKDSRSFGLIKRSQIKGVATFRVLPLSNFGFIEVE
ncbi:signal peptidase I [Streptococcus halichoeri]|uniref:signal peptidase I n=1 Tax=Streptococcus halichoeri TaxID=254785 RepID=UPI000DB46E35|nr:signal peptidase I [Streptococcus halichoeri]PZO95301.1 MAG: signal peptidase I [Streptococcus pyogenes]